MKLSKNVENSHCYISCEVRIFICDDTITPPFTDQFYEISESPSIDLDLSSFTTDRYIKKQTYKYYNHIVENLKKIPNIDIVKKVKSCSKSDIDYIYPNQYLPTPPKYLVVGLIGYNFCSNPLLNTPEYEQNELFDLQDLPDYFWYYRVIELTNNTTIQEEETPYIDEVPDI